MSLTTTEFLLEERWTHEDGEPRARKFGPWDDLDSAKLQQACGRRVAPDHEWVISERDVTFWTPVPELPPDWPEDD